MTRWDPEELRLQVNNYAPYAGARIEVTHIAADATELRVEMALEESNTNLVGTHFGGSLYSMVDPHLMILLMQRLGPEYVVWDRSASIEFLKPGLGRVRSVIRVDDAEVQAIRDATADGDGHLPRWDLEILDEEGDVVARVSKTLYIRQRASG